MNNDLRAEVKVVNRTIVQEKERIREERYKTEIDKIRVAVVEKAL